MEINIVGYNKIEDDGFPVEVQIGILDRCVWYKREKVDMSKWKPSKINQSIAMTMCNFRENNIEVRPLKWWEKIRYFRYILANQSLCTQQLNAAADFNVRRTL